ncbi:hypothetical protein MJH12_06035 [bacterium]|nr:hypothetical protein [bacterium]
MFTHFGIYNEIHTAKPATLSVKEPLSTNKNDKLGSAERFYPRWNSGIAVLGSGTVGGNEKEYDYILQLSNGEDSQTNPYEEDSNTFKAINGRFRYSLQEDLRVGFSFFNDSINIYNAANVLSGS